MAEGDIISTTRSTSTAPSPWSGNGRSIEEVRPIVSSGYGRLVFFVLGGDIVSKPQVEHRPLPDHMYVDIPTLTKNLSLIAIVVCVLSIAVSWATKFSAIQPFLAALIIVASATFYVMAKLIKRSYHDGV
jgi:hypothetical protein